MGRALDDAALTPAAYRLLAYLTSGSSAATVLAAKLAISRPSVTATIDWLEARGYVSRSPDPADGRRSRIDITERGAAALEQANERLVLRLGDLLQGLTPEQARSVLASLDLMSEVLDQDRERRDQKVFGTDIK